MNFFFFEKNCWLLKVRFSIFLRTIIHQLSCFSKFSLEYVNSWPKIMLLQGVFFNSPRNRTFSFPKFLFWAISCLCIIAIFLWHSFSSVKGLLNALQRIDEFLFYFFAWTAKSTKNRCCKYMLFSYFLDIPSPTLSKSSWAIRKCLRWYSIALG